MENKEVMFVGFDIHNFAIRTKLFVWPVED